MKNLRWFLRSKIHMATVTEAEADYVGSITIDSELMERTGLEVGEKVMVTSKTKGGRLETYVIPGKPGSGEICVNGPAALTIGKGEVVVIMGFALSDAPIEPKVILVDGVNRYVRDLGEKAEMVAHV